MLPGPSKCLLIMQARPTQPTGATRAPAARGRGGWAPTSPPSLKRSTTTDAGANRTGSPRSWLKTQRSGGTARWLTIRHGQNRAEQPSSRAAEQPSSRAAEQPSSRAAEQPSSRASESVDALCLQYAEFLAGVRRAMGESSSIIRSARRQLQTSGHTFAERRSCLSARSMDPPAR
jgi:hypothetical protein